MLKKKFYTFCFYSLSLYSIFMCRSRSVFRIRIRIHNAPEYIVFVHYVGCLWNFTQNSVIINTEFLVKFCNSAPLRPTSSFHTCIHSCRKRSFLEPLKDFQAFALIRWDCGFISPTTAAVFFLPQKPELRHLKHSFPLLL